MSTSEEDRGRLVQARRLALGSRLRQLRLLHDLSQEALAIKAGIDRSFYAEVELGKASPRVDYLYDIAAALGVHPAELLREPRS